VHGITYQMSVVCRQGVTETGSGVTYICSLSLGSDILCFLFAFFLCEIGFMSDGVLLTKREGK